MTACLWVDVMEQNDRLALRRERLLGFAMVMVVAAGAVRVGARNKQLSAGRRFQEFRQTASLINFLIQGVGEVRSIEITEIGDIQVKGYLIIPARDHHG